MSGRLASNLVANLANFGVNLLVGLWLTPYLIRQLGVSSYGVVAVATTVASHLSVITLSMNCALSRQVMISGEQHDANRTNCFFNTSLLANCLVLCPLLLLTGLVLSGSGVRIFAVPSEVGADAGGLLFFTACAMAVAAAASSFEVASYCSNRFDLRNLVLVLATVVRVGSIILFFTFLGPRLWLVGLGSLLGALAGMLGAIIVSNRLMPHLSIRLRSFSKSALKELVTTSVWVVINQVGTVLILSVDLLVVNAILGTTATGQYGALVQWAILLRAIGTTIAAVFGPTLVQRWAADDHRGLISYARLSSRLVGLLLALPAGLICGFAEPLLGLWLGPDFRSWAPVVVVMTAHLALNLSYLPLHHIAVAANEVRVPGLVQIGCGVANLILAAALVGGAKLGLMGAALAGGAVLLFRNLVFTPWFAARIAGCSAWALQAHAIPTVVATAFAGLTAWIWAAFGALSTWKEVVGAGVGVSVAYGTLIYLFVATREERERLRQLLSKSVERALAILLKPCLR